MKRRFVTSCDVNYAARALVMMESLLRWSPEAEITVLCLDDQIEVILRTEFCERVSTVSMATLAAREPRLLEVCAQRSAWESYATQKPVLLSWALEHTPEGEVLAFVDADTFFFANPEPIFAEVQAASIAISPHRFNAATAHLAVYGTYNAGFGVWRSDAIGRRCLREWSDDCLNWCFCRVEEGRFMNQGYLSVWPARYERVAILRHPGQNLAPWNVGSHRLERGAGAVLVDGQPLIFFHFSSVFRSADGRWQTFEMCDALRQPLVLRDIYRPYLAALERAIRRLTTRFGMDGTGSVREIDPNIPVLDLVIAEEAVGAQAFDAAREDAPLAK